VAVLVIGLYLLGGLTFLALAGLPSVLTVLGAHRFTGKDPRPQVGAFQVLTATCLTLLIAALFANEVPHIWLMFLRVGSAISLVAAAGFCGLRVVGRVLLVMFGGLILAHIWALVWVLGYVKFVGPLIPSQG